MLWIQPTSNNGQMHLSIVKFHGVIHLLQHFIAEEWRTKSGNDNNAD